MDPIEQNIAIAQACGWKWYAAPRNYIDRVCFFLPPNCDTLLNLSNPFIAGQDGCPPATDNRQPQLPDYLNNIDAMLKALEQLNRNWEITKANGGYICRIECGPGTISGPHLLPVIAEAILKTLDLWRD